MAISYLAKGDHVDADGKPVTERLTSCGRPSAGRIRLEQMPDDRHEITHKQKPEYPTHEDEETLIAHCILIIVIEWQPQGFPVQSWQRDCQTVKHQLGYYLRACRTIDFCKKIQQGVCIATSKNPLRLRELRIQTLSQFRRKPAEKKRQAGRNTIQCSSTRLKTRGKVVARIFQTIRTLP